MLIRFSSFVEYKVGDKIEFKIEEDLSVLTMIYVVREIVQIHHGLIRRNYYKIELFEIEERIKS